MSNDARKDLPPVNSPNFQERLRETVSTYLGNRGNALDRGLTLRDLVDANIIELSNGYLNNPRAGGNPVVGVGPAVTAAYEPDLTPPPTPTGFAVNAAISNIFINCDAQFYTQGHGHARTVVYGATWVSGPKPVFSDAIKITEFAGTTFAHPTNPATTWHLWIKWLTVDGVESALPAGGTNGLVATTGQDVGSLLAALSGKISESQLYSSLGSRINLIDAPSTTPGSVNNRLSAEALARTNALAQEGTTRAQALLNEAAARESAVSDLQTQIDTVVAVAGGDLSSVISAVQTEQTARAAADAAEAASRETLAVQMRGNYTGTDAAAVTTGLLYSERQARIADQEAEVSSRNAAIVSNSASAEATQKAINDALIAGMGVFGAASATRTQAEQDARIASVTQETNARISAIEAEASARLQLVAIVDSNAAVVVQEQLTRATADSALASDINALSARTGANEAAIATEVTTRTTAISAEASQRTSLASALRTEIANGDTATQSTAKAYVDTNFYTKTAQNSAEAAQNTLLRSEFASADAANLNSAKAYVQGYAYTKAQADSAIATQVATVAARLNSGGDILNAINSASTTASTKSASFVQSSTPTATKAGDLWIDTGNGNLLKRWSGSAWVAAEDQRIGATATQINTLQSTVNGNTAAIQTEATTRASQTGALYAKYTVKVDVAGLISGYGLASTANNAEPTSSFGVRANAFSVAPPAVASATAPTTNLYDGYVWLDTSVVPNVTRYRSGSSWVLNAPVLPFVVQATPTTVNGVAVPAGVYMSDAFIQNASITNAKIGNLAVDDAKITNLSVSKLDAGSLKVGSYISSSNYVAGSQGFAVWATGAAEFNNVTVRGTIYASSGVFTGKVYASDGSFTGAVTATSGSFTGSIYSSSGTIGGLTINGNGINSGSYVGYAWPTDGGGGFHLGPRGLLLGNANLGKYLEIKANGDISTPGFNVINGTMTVHQANVINTLNVAGNAITAVSAAIGPDGPSTGWPAHTALVMCTLSFYSTGAPILFFSGVQSVGGSNSVPYFGAFVRLVIDGGVRTETALEVTTFNYGDGRYSSSFGGSYSFAPSYITNLGAGWHTAQLQLVTTAAIAPAYWAAIPIFSGATISTLETKR